MTSNTRVVVIGAGRTGTRAVRPARPTRRSGVLARISVTPVTQVGSGTAGTHAMSGTPVTLGTPVPPVCDEEHRRSGRAHRAGRPAGRRHAPEVTARTAGRADGTAIAYDTPAPATGCHPRHPVLPAPRRPFPPLRQLLTNDGGS
ncbi:hypothetical protein AB5J52_15325 [Streptomyces sp. R39]|uniref:FAD/NAD(P)-binding domain-containing protein n=1 Tax=Streptomyces sp. R39 TaxID=3238631 RepID=A0AB39QRJ5_9ACTN